MATILGDHDDGPGRFDPAGVALQMSAEFGEWATGLMAVPLLTTLAFTRSGSEPYGAVLCRVLERKCGHLLDRVVAEVPTIWDATEETHPDVVRALELIEERADNLWGQALGLAEAG